MIHNSVENSQVLDLRCNLTHLQETADRLAHSQLELTHELERALLLVMELPQDKDDNSQFPREQFLNPDAGEETKPIGKGDRVSNLRQELSNGQKLAADVLRQQNHLKSMLTTALREAMELHHAEVQGRNEIGGEG